MNVRRTAIAFGAVLLVWGLWIPDEAHAQRYSSDVRLPSGRAALVRTLLNSVNARRRAEAAEELGETGDERVLEALATAAAHDTEPVVRRAATHSIRQIRGGRSRDRDEDHQGFLPPPPPRDPNVVLVQSWYQRYLGRSVDESGVATWAGLLARGTPAEDVQASILASEESWRLRGARPAGFIRGIYEAVLNRTPTRGEMDTWGRRYNLLRGDRLALCKEFLVAAQRELLGNDRHDHLYR